jgi:stage V sporulation protein AD
VTLNGPILHRLQRGSLKRVLFMATGALLSTTSSQQGVSIPGVAHAIVLEGGAACSGRS